MNRRVFHPSRVMSVIALSGAVWILSLSAWTQGEADETARARYQEGVGLFNEGRYAEAASAFREAMRLKPSWKILFNIGQSEAAAGRFGLALEAFEGYLAQGRDEIGEERKDYVLKEMARMRDLVGQLEIRGQEGALIRIDGVERGTTPLPGRVRIEVGVTHEVRAEKDGKALLTRTVRVGTGETIMIEVPQAAPASVAAQTPAQAPQPPIPSPSPREGEGGEEKTEPMSQMALWGWVSVGVGGALVVSGAVTGGMALSKASDLADRCPDKVCADPADEDLKSSADSLALATDILIPLGAALAATGAILLIVDSGSDDEADQNAVASVSVGPGVLVLEGRF